MQQWQESARLAASLIPSLPLLCFLDLGLYVGSEDGAFRAPEYTINSAPKTGEAPYVISYVESLPVLQEAS